MKIEKAPFLYNGPLEKGGVLFSANEILKVDIGSRELSYCYRNGQMMFSQRGLTWTWTATDNWHIYKIEEKEDEKG